MENKDKALIITLCLVVVLIILPLTVSSFSSDDYPPTAYKHGVAYMEEGDYESAYALFRQSKMWNYKDSNNLRWYCCAQIELADGRPDKARDTLRLLSDDYAKLDYVAKFRRQVDQKYSWYRVKEQEDLEAQRKQEAAEARRGRPQVGMSEKYVEMTTWGKAGKIRTNSSMEKGQRVFAKLYDFYQSGHLRYTVRCAHGTVQEVYDWGDSFGAVSGSSSYSGYVDTSDPYDAQDYSHPDDFYYDHYEGFWDFEDAEDYYYDD